MDERGQGKPGALSASSTAFLGQVLAGTAVFMVALSVFGSRWGLWDFRFGFKLLMTAALCGLLSVVVSVIALITALRGGVKARWMLSCISLAIGLTVFGVPFSWYHAAKNLPRIHDISTDTDDPPLFVAVIPLRQDAPNSSVYGGPDIALKQHEAYTDIKPLVLDVPPDNAFDRALLAARRMSWQIVDADKKEMRIEATDTTFWFGFKDDIVVRITPLDKKSRIDVRSESRVGLSDVGTNAMRIRKYFRQLSKEG